VSPPEANHLSSPMLAVAAPSPTQRAARRARAAMLLRASSAHSAFLDAYRNPTDRHHPLNVNSWRVDVVRIDSAGFDEFLDLGDRDSARSGSGRIEIAGTAPVHQVPEPVTLVGVHEGVIGNDRALQNVSRPVEFAGLLGRACDDNRAGAVVAERQATIDDRRADSGGGEECRDAGTPGAHSFGQCALRGEFHLQFPGEVLPGEFGVLSDIGADGASDAPSRQQHAEARSIGATVVADDFQRSRALLEQGVDQHLWHANQAKSADRERGSVRYVGHGLCGGRDDFVDHDRWGMVYKGPLLLDNDYSDYVGQERCSTQDFLCAIRTRASSTRRQLLLAGGRFRRVGVLCRIVRNANPTTESGSAMRRNESAPAPSPEFVQSLGRGLAVIRAFDAHHRRLTLTEVAKLTDLTRATARRFLLTLVELGYVATDGSVFWLTPQVLQLGYSYLSSLSLNEIATPHIEALVRKVGESSSMAILDGDDIVYVARVPVSRIMTVFITVGTRFPAYATSMGRVILAGLTDRELKEYLKRVTLAPLTERTVSSRTALKHEINSVRRDGYCIVDQELEQGLRSLAAPVHDQSGSVVAAINISTQAARYSAAQVRRQLVTPLVHTAQAISADVAMAQLRLPSRAST
jgi:IclR family transcriptional regulator, pca regulon regulatory protein